MATKTDTSIDSLLRTLVEKNGSDLHVEIRYISKKKV